MSELVQLYVYDLSRGMAKAMSMAFLGRQIDAIFHTSIVVFGREYYYGGHGDGINRDIPGQTPHGTPQEVIQMGFTEVNEQMFDDFIGGILPSYRPEDYHLMNNNCNHFSNEASQFLVGKHIPDKIRDLPDDFLQTPLGRQLGPLIDGFFSSMNTSQPSFRSSGRSGSQDPPRATSRFRQLRSEEQLEAEISRPGLLIVAVTSGVADNNPKLIEVGEIVETVGTIPQGCWESGSVAVGCIRIEKNDARGFVQKHGISRTPVFMTFVSGSLKSTITSHDRSGIELALRSLIQDSVLKHSHVDLPLESSVSSLKPIVYRKGDASVICQKLEAFGIDGGVLSDIKAAIEWNIDLPQEFLAILESVYVNLKEDQVFAIVDLLRLCTCTKNGGNLINESGMHFVLAIVQRFGFARRAAEMNIPASAVLVTFRLVSNILSYPRMADYLLSNDVSEVSYVASTVRESPVHILADAVQSHFIEESADFSGNYIADSRIFESIASVVYNIALATTTFRQVKRGLVDGVDSIKGWENEFEEPEYVVELSSSTIHKILTVPSDESSLGRLLVSVLYFLYLSPGDLMKDLALAMELPSAVEKIEHTSSSTFSAVCRDVKKLLQ